MMKKKRTKINWAGVAVIIIVTGLTYYLSQKTANTGVLQGGITSIITHFDSQFSDFYASYLHGSNREASPSITIVSLQDCQDRKKIAQLVDVIDSLQPKVIGFDVLMPDQTENDSQLIYSLSNCNNLVMARWINDSNELISYPIDGYLKEKTIGIINSEGHTLLDKQRCFKVGFRLANGDSFDGFAPAVVKYADPEKYKALKERKHDTEFINYHRLVKFHCVAWNEVINSNGKVILKSNEDFQDKIVLIGIENIEDSCHTQINEDAHITPINEVWTGTRIHAAAIDTILKDDYVNTVSSNTVNSVSIIVLLLWILFLFWSSEKLESIKPIASRVVQVIIILIVFTIGIYFYRNNKYYDFSLIVIGMGISTVCFDIFYSIYLYFNNKHQNKKS